MHPDWPADPAAPDPRDDAAELRRLVAFVETRRRDLAAQGGSAGLGALANAEALLVKLRQGFAFAQRHRAK